MSIKKQIIVVCFVVSLSSCNTGKVAYNRGDYYDATMQSVQCLRLKPSSEKAIATLKKSYPMAIDYYTQKVNELNISNDPDKCVKIVEFYTKLNQLGDEIARCPAALEAVKPVIYFHEQLQKAKELAAKEQYGQAIALLQSGTIEDARLAYARLEKVKMCEPNFNGIDRLLAESEDKATLKVVVEQIPVISDMYQVNAKVFYNRIFGYLKQCAEKQFVKFYRPNDAEELKITPQQIVRMQFYDFSIGSTHDREIEQSFQSDSLITGKYTDEKGISHDVKGIVNAKVITYQREVLSKGVFNLNIIDYHTGDVIINRKFPGEYVWRTEWATFNGDSRAVPEEKAKLTEQKQQLPPLPQELFLLFSDPIFTPSSSFLGSYYRKQ
jgi:hypothetical protein